MSAALNIYIQSALHSRAARWNFKNNRILTYDECFWFHQVANAKESRLCAPRVSHPSLCTDCISCGCEHVSLWGACALSHSLLSLAFTTRWNHASIICKYSVVFNILKNYYINRCLPLVVFWISFLDIQ